MSAFDNAAKPGLIVDFDALFDTRLSILDQLDPLLAVHALNHGYLDREEDSFEFCKIDLFKQLYAKRDHETLGRSMMTQVKDIVIDFMNDSIKKLKSERTQAQVNVYINVWPYKISEDAAGDVLKPFFDAVNGKANIHMVNLAPHELTPKVCKDNFSYVIKYDYMEWLIILGELNLLQNNSLQEVTLIAPRLYPSGKPENIEIENETRNKMEPYQCAEFFFAPYINLELYVSRLFSANISQEFINAYTEEIAAAQKEERLKQKTNDEQTA